MTMATKLARCLSRTEARFETVRRPGRPGQLAHPGDDTARSIPADRLARTVLLEDDKGYLAAVIPASHHLKLAELREQTGRKVAYAHADGVREVCRDCDRQALPPVGMAYGTLTWIDDSLLTHDDVYFEAGDREALVHMNVDDFAQLMSEARRGHFSHRVM
ncbi:hypothetical protein D9X30_2897 [Cupriavidus sp. U2]|uniref:aminoacyl-tRNA deacylase n=1 Tax=Cupriavidus sp. U2 TaxID=2920269 RepID=UPI00129D5581|nr:YbaK/EbsC family protein [Cupriavidus sp. U2]KAI3592094.1 hypothetical protein D9X30_2897 [Cupriavidus sp. U2]